MKKKVIADYFQQPVDGSRHAQRASPEFFRHSATASTHSVRGGALAEAHEYRVVFCFVDSSAER